MADDELQLFEAISVDLLKFLYVIKRFFWDQSLSSLIYFIEYPIILLFGHQA